MMVMETADSGVQVYLAADQLSPNEESLSKMKAFALYLSCGFCE
jgi:hypothetical protein